MNREQIFSALFTLIGGSAGFVTKSRRFRSWDDMQPESLPAIFQVEGNEVITRQKGVPQKYELSVELFVYVHVDDENTSPSSALNTLLDSIEARLKPLPGCEQTLGLDNVSHCWVSGTIEKFHGFLGNKGVAIVPVSILATEGE